MDFTRIQSAMDACKNHLDATGGNPQVENYLVGYLLTTIYAEYEKILVKVVVARIARIASHDAGVHRFIHVRIENRKGRIEISDLCKMLEGFGASCKNNFEAEINGQPSKDAWKSILVNRLAVAHGIGSMTMTLSDLKTAFHDSKGVLRAFARASGLKASEISSL